MNQPPKPGMPVRRIQRAWAALIAPTFPRRLFGTDGVDETAEDVCELYTQTKTGARADRTLKVKPDPAMGRVRAAKNFVLALRGKEAPLNTPDQAVKLMKIIDALYASAARKAPVRVK